MQKRLFEIVCRHDALLLVIILHEALPDLVIFFSLCLFPFLFGIMFGDFGHGLLLAALGGFLIKKEKDFEGQKMNDMLAMMYGGRYIILLNGLFGAALDSLLQRAKVVLNVRCFAARPFDSPL